MGCYGIGVSRVFGIIAEIFSKEDSLYFPENIAPYKYYLVSIGEKADQIAAELAANHPETILLDDRDLRPGTKFADADLIGCPYRLVISDKTLENDQIELLDRKTGETKLLTQAELTDKL